MNSRKTAGAVLGTLGGLTALTAASAEILYNFSINTKSPIHMSKLNNLIQKKALHEYGMTREQIEEFTDSVIANQGRLMANNFVELDRDRLIKIYTELY